MAKSNRGGKLRSSTAPKLNFTKYDDVQDEYTQKATPGKGTITQTSNFTPETHPEEVEFAKWLFKTYGGDIIHLQELGEIKWPDYTWNGKLWELKTVSSEEAANNAIKTGHKQIKSNPGGIMLNFNKADFSWPKFEKTLDNRLKWYKNTSFDIMVVNNWKTVKIIRHKK